jgi:bacterioferritin-associated ferredoxin
MIVCKCFKKENGQDDFNSDRVNLQLTIIHQEALKVGNSGAIRNDDESLENLYNRCSYGQPQDCGKCFPILKEMIDEYNSDHGLS